MSWLSELMEKNPYWPLINGWLKGYTANVAKKKIDMLARQYDVDIGDPVHREYFTKGVEVLAQYAARELEQLLKIK